MEKEKLHRFFAGTTSIQEGMDIRAWMEASEENKRKLARSDKRPRASDAESLHLQTSRGL